MHKQKTTQAVEDWMVFVGVVRLAGAHGQVVTRYAWASRYPIPVGKTALPTLHGYTATRFIAKL
ncbi:MAG: hypothetical protein ABL885_05760 [Methylophilaceae bacterium]